MTTNSADLSVPLTIKWGKESFKLKWVVDSGVKGLKTELEEQTGVPNDRMKLMAKSKGLWKGVLKDDCDLSTIDFAAALTKNKGVLNLLLMGSATKLAAPKVKTVFLEDLPPEEIAKVKEPSGLTNLGNTCYLNSVVQCLRAIKPLRQGLSGYTPSSSSTSSHSLTGQANTMFLGALRDTFASLDRTAEAVSPMQLVQATRSAFPQFAQPGPQGQPMQQDAEEFYSGLLTIASSETTGTNTIQRGLGSKVSADELKGADNLVDAVFGLKMEETLTCDELEASAEVTEPPVKSFDLQRKLVCNIQGGSDGNSSKVNVSHVAEGIQLSLEGKLEKRSEVLGRDAMWTRRQRIARLPPVLVVQFGRFYWKETPDSQDHSGVKCKVMKPVAFNGILDVYDFCSEDVQKVLKKARDKALKEDEERINRKLQGKEETKSEDVEMKDAAEDEEELKAALAMSMEPEFEPIGPGLPTNFQGQYELFAVVTHKGRDADGGHYMGWVKAENQPADGVQKIGDSEQDNENWYVFDDDEVSPCQTEDVLKLKGGGDWHMSYLNFYRAKK
eukprot:CAMPEP_0194032660 /NCGR_PEP_ID=MMETSP0009_2-20130614/5551_1 /TAXON_ID=210454 /ORGANISM="Grammatophora oceanica, Strain CCMP 410" /LENGTH=556 /DNA_ID=CAMNT_0038673169 /DNA_START=19 /DNA_END=1689 /DNA_ORIENTATION=+